MQSTAHIQVPSAPTKAVSTIPKAPTVDTSSPSQSIITVVRDPKHNLGKQISIDTDGNIIKKSAVTLSLGIARMHQVETHQDLSDLLESVGEDPSAAIINARFNDIDIGEEFLILSERQITKRLGIPQNDRSKQVGVHTVEYKGRSMKAIGRFKENVTASCWQYFDRDIDQHTPEGFASMSPDEWYQELLKPFPELAGLCYCVASSTSSRVMRDGQPVGSGNGHFWFKVKDPSDIVRFRTASMIAAAEADITWIKPRYSRSEPEKTVGKSLTTIFDPSVFTPGRLTFVGKPVVDDGLTVKKQTVQVIMGSKDTFDTSSVVLPEAEKIKSVTRKAGVEMRIKSSNNVLVVHASDLSLDTEIETEGDGIQSIRQIVESGKTEKLRCQTPFRDSNSYAAFVGFSKDGTPFIHDVGTNTTHWLVEFETQELKLIRAKAHLSMVTESVLDDCGAPFEAKAIEALAVLQENQPAEYQRMRADLKKHNKSVSVIAIDKAVKEKKIIEDDLTPETHYGYASRLINDLTINGSIPVGHDGQLFVYDEQTSIWAGNPPEKLKTLVAESNDGLPNCQRHSDYTGIANLAIDLKTDPTFFTDAPVGLACPTGFYSIENNEINCVPLTADHRQRVKIDITPQDEPTPLFNQFLHETFKSDISGEEEQQISLLQEFTGATMLGITHRYQKAVMFIDCFGRAGKGTLERFIRGLVPSEFVTAISPFNWGREYYIASLAGARLNVVGELPEHDSIPSAAFKTVTGGDLLTGRHPTHRTITFKNEASHLFMTNHLINTRDHSEAFYARWLIIEFPNSRLRSGLPIDPDLADRIIATEMPGIAHWALQGAMRLLKQGRFSESIAHDRLMAQWRYTSNSLEEFIHDCCDIGDEQYKIRRSEFYSLYSDWCKDSGRRPFAKGKVKDLLSYNIGLSIVHASLDGIEIFRGVRIKPADKASTEAMLKGVHPKSSSQNKSNDADAF